MILHYLKKNLPLLILAILILGTVQFAKATTNSTSINGGTSQSNSEITSDVIHTAANQPPTVSFNDSYNLKTYGGILTVNWTASDPEGDKLSFDLVLQDVSTNQYSLAIGISGTSFAFDTSVYANGSAYLLFLTVSDGFSSVTIQTDGGFTILNFPNQAPTVAFTDLYDLRTFTGDILVNWTASDPEGDTLTFSLVLQDVSNKQFTIATGITGTSYVFHTIGYTNGSAYFLILTASDGHSTVTVQSDGGFTIVNFPNQGPTISFTDLYDLQTFGGVLTVNWTASDPEGDPLTFSLALVDAYAQQFPIAYGITNTTYSFNTAYYANGSAYYLILTASDGISSVFVVSDGGFTILNFPNQAPTVAFTDLYDLRTFTGEIILNWTASDPEGDPLTFSLVLEDVSNTQYPIASGITNTTYLFNTVGYDNGSAYFLLLSASDGHSTVTVQSDGGFTILNFPNQAPSVSFTDSYNDRTFGGQITVNWTASDPEGDPLTFSLVLEDVSNHQVTLATGITNTTYLFNTEYYANQSAYVLILTASDGYSTVEVRSDGGFTILNFPDQAPSVSFTDSYNDRTFGGILTVNWTASDPEGDVLTFSLVLRDASGHEETLATGITDTIYLFNTAYYANGSAYSLILTASDGQRSTVIQSDGGFTILNFPDNTNTGTTLSLPETWSGIILGISFMALISVLRGKNVVKSKLI